MFSLFKAPDPEAVLTPAQLRRIQRHYNKWQKALKTRDKAWDKVIGIKCKIAFEKKELTEKLLEAEMIHKWHSNNECDLFDGYLYRLHRLPLKHKTERILKERLKENRYGKTKKPGRKACRG